MTDTPLTPADYRTADKRLHRESYGSGFAFRNPQGQPDYDRLDELPPAVFGLLSLSDWFTVERRKPKFSDLYRRIAA